MQSDSARTDLAPAQTWVDHQAPRSHERHIVKPGYIQPDRRSAIGYARPSRKAARASTRSLPSNAHAQKLRSLVAGGVVALALGWIALAPEGGWISLAALVFGAVLIVRPGIVTREATIMLLTTTLAVSAVDYLSWRWTVINWGSWWIALPLFGAELFGSLHALGLQYTVWPRQERPLVASEDPTRAPIFIFIPTVNEGVTILEPTVRGALVARAEFIAAFPHARVTIVVCNDGRVANAPNWQETEALAERLGVICITRTVGGGAKAGNIEHARQHLGATGKALLVIFDADQIAEPDFLLKIVLPFAAGTVGWVQSGQYYRNRDNPVARWADDQQALFYRILCPGKATQNAAFICGTNVMLRAAVLDEIGGLPQDSVTEDFAASITLHPRWHGIFLTDVLATGLGPMDLASFFKQQGRWATGTLGVLRSQWRAILLPGRNGLRLEQRVQYALACTHYLCGVRDFIYIVVPLMFVVTGVPAVRGAYLSAFLWHFLPYGVASQAAFWYVARGKTSFRGIVISFGSFPVLIRALLTVIRGRKVHFAITAKQRSTGRGWPLMPHAIFFLLCLIGMIIIIGFKGLRGPLLITALWVAYSMLMLGGMLGLGTADAWAKRGLRWSSDRHIRRWRSLARPRRRVVGPALAAVMAIAVVGFVQPSRIFSADPARFEPRLEATGHPYLGISLPAELLASGQASLERQLGLSFAIVGRTQVISDWFDRAWADRLAKNGARPWITLLFGVPGTPSLDASLPAIANGIDDDALRRWARSMRDYGRPIYLTILPQVDRNWALSSAVANGGIPQDTPRAWAHVRTIFREEGASNVAWAWAPADPGGDQAYAPPAATIDVVVITMLHYPGTAWGNPLATLRDRSRRYPTTPLFVEVSAAGPPVQKASWLREVGAAVAALPNVQALLYHEGGPLLHVTADKLKPWSITSDPLALRAMRVAAQLAGVRPSVDEKVRHTTPAIRALPSKGTVGRRGPPPPTTATAPITMYNFQRTALVGQTEYFAVTLPRKPGALLTYVLRFADGHEERVNVRADSHGHTSHTFHLSSYQPRKGREAVIIAVVDASGEILARTRFAIQQRPSSTYQVQHRGSTGTTRSTPSQEIAGTPTGTRIITQRNAQHAVPRATTTPMPPTSTAIATPAVRSTPTAVTLILTPIADTYVRDGSYADTNFGADHDLYVKQATKGFDRYAYLKFDLSGIHGPITGAMLRLYGRNPGSGSYSGTDLVYAVTDNNWVETGSGGVTWSTRPALSGAPLAAARIGPTSEYYGWNVSSFVAQQQAKQQVSLGVVMSTRPSTNLPDLFNGREAAMNQPQLVVTTR